MQQLDHRTWEGMRDLFINRKWHHCTTGSAKALVWCLGSQYHNNASSALLVIWYLLCSYSSMKKNGKWEASEHMLLNTEIWGLSTEHTTFASERIKCAAQTNIIPIHSHDISSQCFPISVIAIGVSNIIVFIEIYWDQTTVHSDVTTNVIHYQYKRRPYKRAKCCRCTEVRLALYF